MSQQNILTRQDIFSVFNTLDLRTVDKKPLSKIRKDVYLLTLLGQGWLKI